jgi:hypothetical protein
VALADLVQSHAFRTLLFGIAGVLSLFAAERAAQAAGGWSRELTSKANFWLIVSVVLFVLGTAKLLGLQHLLGGNARELVREEGFYDVRHAYQRLANYAVIAVGLLAFAVGTWIWVRRWTVLALPLGVVVVLVSFVAIRAISLHDVDTLLYRTDVWGVQASAAVEVLLTASTALVAFVSTLCTRSS